MSLDKAIKSGKEKRKPYVGSKFYDSSCRNHGDCRFCASNRLYNKNKLDEQSKQKIKEYMEEKE